MKFVVFEKTIQLIYDRYLQTTRAECGKAYNLFWTFVSGYIAGIVCAIVSHPADTIFTAMNKSKEPTTVAKVYEKIGFGGLWKGLGPRILMIGTLTGLQWWIYDSYKALVGLPASGNTGLPKK